MPKVVFLFLCFAGCAAMRVPVSQETAHALPPSQEIRAALLARARAFEGVGAYLEASYFFEAALASGGDEHTTLPLLIGALVRANRLRAAKIYLHRLQQLVPGEPHLAELGSLLARFAPEDDDVARMEEKP